MADHKFHKTSKGHQARAEEWSYRMQTASEIVTILLLPGGKLFKAGEIGITLLQRGI